MAKSYRPYTTDRRLKNRRLKMVMLALIVVIVGLVVLIKSQPAESSVRTDETLPPPTVPLNEVQPPLRYGRRASPGTTNAAIPAGCPRCRTRTRSGACAVADADDAGH